MCGSLIHCLFLHFPESPSLTRRARPRRPQSPDLDSLASQSSAASAPTMSTASGNGPPLLRGLMNAVHSARHHRPPSASAGLFLTEKDRQGMDTRWSSRDDLLSPQPPPVSTFAAAAVPTTSTASGTLFVALYDFNGIGEEQLTLRKGTINENKRESK